MDVTEKVSNLTALAESVRKRIEEEQKRLREEAQVFFNDAMKEIFTAFPELVAITWNQYTPYFNDGEPCTFSVHDWHYVTTDDLKEHGMTFEEMREESSWWGEEFGNWASTYKTEEGTLTHTLAMIRNAVDDETLLHIFGDHVSVVITRDTVAVTECDHD